MGIDFFCYWLVNIWTNLKLMLTIDWLMAAFIAAVRLKLGIMFVPSRILVESPYPENYLPDIKGHIARKWPDLRRVWDPIFFELLVISVWMGHRLRRWSGGGRLQFCPVMNAFFVMWFSGIGLKKQRVKKTSGGQPPLQTYCYDWIKLLSSKVWL